MEIDDSEVHTGLKSFKITADNASGDSTSGRLVRNQMPMETDKTYTIAFWAKVDESEEQSRPIKVSAEEIRSRRVIYAEDIILDSTDWKEYTSTFTTEGAVVGVSINIGISQTATNFWLDDFRFFADSPSEEFISGDVSADGGVDSYDAVLALQYIVKQETLTDLQMRAADMNGDGIVGSNDIILILREIVGLAAPGTGALVGNSGLITIALAEAHSTAGERMTVPLVVDNIDALAGGDIQITYDSTVLRAVGVSSDPEILLESSISESGMVRISFVGVEGLNSETLARIHFDVLGDGISMLTIRNADLYNPEGLPLISGSMDREIIPPAMPPQHSALLQNFPNPFNPDTWIPYQLREDGEVTIRIFSLQGDIVRELDLGVRSAGLYVDRDGAAHWDGRNDAGETVASGVYFYSISAGDFAAVRKLTVLR